MKRCAGDGGSTNHFADRFDAGTGLMPTRASDMDEDGNVPLGSQPKHIDHFETRSARYVLKPHTDTQRAGIELVT